jgi:hypothetical protein
MAGVAGLGLARFGKAWQGMVFFKDFRMLISRTIERLSIKRLRIRAAIRRNSQLAEAVLHGENERRALMAKENMT